MISAFLTPIPRIQLMTNPRADLCLMIGFLPAPIWKIGLLACMQGCPLRKVSTKPIQESNGPAFLPVHQVLGLQSHIPRSNCVAPCSSRGSPTIDTKDLCLAPTFNDIFVSLHKPITLYCNFNMYKAEQKYPAFNHGRPGHEKQCAEESMSMT